MQVQSRAAYLLFYRQRAAAAADPPDLVPQLLEARQQHLAAKEAAAAAAAEAEQQAAAAAVAAGGLVAVDGDGGLEAMAVDGEPASPTAAASGFVQGLALIPAAGSPAPDEGWASPVLGTPAGAAAGEGLLGGVGSPAPAPPAPAPVQPGGGAGRAGSGRRMGGVEDSSDTSTSLRNTGGLEEGDSSDGSSSRPRVRGAGLVQRQREAAAAQEAAEAVDSWGPLQGGVGGGSGGAAAARGEQPQLRTSRQSDQDVGDADMADRDA